jgi:integrase
MPLGADGIRRQGAETCKGLTKAEAEARLVEIERKIKYGILPEQSLTVSQWAAEWMERERANWTLETYRKYEQVMRLHILPVIGKMKILDVRTPHIQSLIDKKLNTLAPKTINSIRGAVHRLFECALAAQAIMNNPVHSVTTPRLKRVKVKTADKAELSQLMAAVNGTDIEMIVRIAIFAGLRRGELCGLKWDDLNISTGTLTVQRSITQVRGIVEEKPTKTDAPRQIKLSDSLLTALKAYRLKLQKSSKLSEWMCVKLKGGRHTPYSLGRSFHRVAVKAGMKLTLHSLRHTQATMLINAGVPVKVVSERLGHSTTTITQNLYTHVLPHMQDQAASVLETELDGIE